MLERTQPWRVVAVVGNPRPRSRTFHAVTTVAAALAAAVGGEAEPTIDLIDLAGGLFQFGEPNVKAALERVLAADALVIGSPVFKASFTGLLKAFLDQIGAGELHRALAVPMMVGGAPQHALAVEVHLRPVLVELGATCATPGLFVLESELDALPAIAADYARTLVERLPRLPDLPR